MFILFILYISDSEFIFKLTGSSNITSLPGIYSDSPVNSESLFENVPIGTLKKLYNYFFMDFLLFNYTIDSFLIKDRINV